MDTEKKVIQNSVSDMYEEKNLFRQLFKLSVSGLQNHKEWIRKKMPQIDGNLPLVLSILPFLLGFFQFINYKYPSEQKKFFFEKNLPGLRIPSEKLHWDTFEYLLETRNFLSSTDKIYWSSKNLTVFTKINEEFLSTNKINLISLILSNENNQWSKLILPSTGSLFDEFPNKLQGNSYSTFNLKLIEPRHEKISDFNSLDFSSFIFNEIDKTLCLNFIGVNFQSNSFQDYTSNQAYTDDEIENEFVEFVDNTITPDTIESLNIDNLNFETNLQELNKKEFIYENEVRNVWINTATITDTINFSENTLSFDFLLENQNLNILQELLEHIDNFSISPSSNLTRSMSGYRYPDMNILEIQNLCGNKTFSFKSVIHVILPPNYATTQCYEFDFPYIEPFLVQIKPLKLTDTSNGDFLYKGPAFLVDSQNGYDWKFLSNNEEKNLKTSLQSYFNSNNPLIDSLTNFFENRPSIRTSQGSNYWFNNLAIFKDGAFAKTFDSPIPYKPSFQLPFFQSSNWLEEIKQNLDPKTSVAEEYQTILLPIIETRLNRLNNLEFNYGVKQFLDFEFTPPGQKFNIQFGENSDFLNLKNLSFDTLIQRQFTSGKYQKTSSIFTNYSQTFFIDIWEPLTINSWLVGCQIGFAYLVFSILKALADNYGRELLVYLLDLVALLGFLDDELKQEIEILMGQREKGFRIIEKTRQNFQNIAGIESLLPQIVEIIWFLRNSGKEFSLSQTIPHGILLTGPPGTGKTFLVQAIAGEAEVPVLALSGSSLLEPGESGALKLENLFQEARRLAPCIVFIDEIDTLAQKREQVMQNPMGTDELLEELSHFSKNKALSEVEVSYETSTQNDINAITNSVFAQQDLSKEKLRILMQFLVELDGIQTRHGVVVFGATNRAEVLDPAILRPGRFDRIFELGLPGPEKRKEILELYSSNLGVEIDLPWKYLVQRTFGYSAADLASIMNQSTLYAILHNSKHTVKTIEHGIDRITTISLEKPQKTNTKYISPAQIAYYQAGKILISSLLEYHPPTLVSYLWPRETNSRAQHIQKNLQNHFLKFARRIELEHKLIGSYAGKAAEILFIQTQDFGEILSLSNFGSEDIQFGQHLANCMVRKWYFYGKNDLSYKTTKILETSNLTEYRSWIEKLPVFTSFLADLENIITAQTTQFSTYDTRVTDEFNFNEHQAQKHFGAAKLQYEVSNEFEITTRSFSNWYRLYLPDPKQIERNLEWIPPDEYFHGNNLTKPLSNTISWNELGLIQLDYKCHSLILQSFNYALGLLDNHRPILDTLAYELLHREILREPEIQKILSNFNLTTSNQLKDNFTTLNLQKKIFIQSNWGTLSRRKQDRWINLRLLKNQQ